MVSFGIGSWGALWFVCHVFFTVLDHLAHCSHFTHLTIDNLQNCFGHDNVVVGPIGMAAWMELRLQGRYFANTAMQLPGRLVTSPCAFRLGSLAQKVLLTPGLRHFSCIFPGTKACDTSIAMCISIAQARTKRVAQSHEMLFVTCPGAFALRRLAQNIRRMPTFDSMPNMFMDKSQHSFGGKRNLPDLTW